MCVCGSLPPSHISFHLNHTVRVTGISTSGRTRSAGTSSSTSLALSCFPSSPAAQALAVATFLTIYLAGPLFLVACAHEMVFFPDRFVLQGATGMAPELLPSVFRSEGSDGRF